MEQNAKKKIKGLTLSQIDIAGSANKYATKIGVSGATISNLVNDKWDDISDEMWNKLATACGYKADRWNVVETKNFKKITHLLHEAKTFGESYGFVSPQGTSKTIAIKTFALNYPDVIHLECEEHWTKKEFLTKLYNGMGRNSYSLSVGQLLENIHATAIKSTTPPVIALDELDKVRDELLYFFISLYNRLHGNCGLFVCATPYLQERILKGIRSGKKGYAEFYSRMGGKFIHGVLPDGADITMICRANGIQQDADIEDIIKDCNQDLRRVERLINAKRRKMKKNIDAEPPREGREM